MAQRGDADAEDAPRRHGQHLAALAEVAGEEDDEQDLGELARLDLELTDAQPEAGAVDRGAERDRQEQQPDRDRAARVLERLEPADVAGDDHHGDEQHQAEQHPDPLVAGQLRRDPVDLDQADGGQHRGDRQHVRIGVGQHDPDDSVRDEVGEREEQRGGQRCRRELLGAGQLDGGEAGRRDQQRQRDQAELAVAARQVQQSAHGRHGVLGGVRSHGDDAISPSTRAWALSSEPSRWSSSVRRSSADRTSVRMSLIETAR